MRAPSAAVIAFLLLVAGVLAGCDALDEGGRDASIGEAHSIAGGPRAEGPGCSSYVVMAIWGQSNAVRGDRLDEVPRIAELDVAISLGGDTTNVIRENGDGTYTQIRDESLDGSITVPGRLTAYVDLANSIFETTGHCVVFTSAALSGSGMQYAANPQRYWDPDYPGNLLENALARLRAAVADYDPEHVLVYWNQGLRDGLAAHPVTGLPDVTIEGWAAAFSRLVEVTEDSLAADGRTVRFLLSLSSTESCSVQSDPITDSLMTHLHNTQRAVTFSLPQVYLTSEVMPDSTTVRYYARDGRHLRWTQYRYCENPAIAFGIENVLNLRVDRYWEPHDSCSLTFNNPQPCAPLRGEALYDALRAAMEDE